MRITEAMDKELEKLRIIKYAASLGIKLTVLDRPAVKRPVPEKYRNVAHNVKPNES
ncbi:MULTISPECIES: hypothetical protein [Niastella]|uniref:Uncharacterized protein n=1 Tax=Niastella soli TaxID=2821487 RepID=A0ABS3Z4C3_9BACT|nr:hypothetical protein [Niastella soli]MBO9205019.1 hypothetical protein [Niastella soli]